jgi:hypothetical protein
VVVRPDHVIAWRSADVAAVDAAALDSVAATLTGVDATG